MVSSHEEALLRRGVQDLQGEDWGDAEKEKLPYPALPKDSFVGDVWRSNLYLEFGAAYSGSSGSILWKFHVEMMKYN
jgi:hypothetical protein